MKRYVTTADLFALILPALAAVAGTWHLVYNHNDNPLGRTAEEIGLLYAMYAGGYLMWGAIARATGASSVGAINATIMALGYVTWIGFIIPVIPVISLAGLAAALAWGSRRRDAEWSIPSPVRAPATEGDAVAIVLPAILVAATIIAYANTGTAPVKALLPWAMIVQYIGYMGGFWCGRLLGVGRARRVVVPGALVAVICAAFGSTSLGGVLMMIFVGAPAAGAAAAGVLDEWSRDAGAASATR